MAHAYFEVQLDQVQVNQVQIALLDANKSRTKTETLHKMH